MIHFICAKTRKQLLKSALNKAKTIETPSYLNPIYYTGIERINSQNREKYRQSDLICSFVSSLRLKKITCYRLEQIGSELISSDLF